jgi:hypothetical protein
MVQYMQVSVYLIHCMQMSLMNDEMLRIDARFIKLNGKRKAFFKGGNSTCRLHIRQHYEIYKERCK